jgi:hypothetical protein
MDSLARIMLAIPDAPKDKGRTPLRRQRSRGAADSTEKGGRAPFQADGGSASSRQEGDHEKVALGQVSPNALLQLARLMEVTETSPSTTEQRGGSDCWLKGGKALCK